MLAEASSTCVRYPAAALIILCPVQNFNLCLSVSGNTTESEEVLFDLHRVSCPPRRCLCPLFERMLYIYHQLMQTVTWIDSLYRSGPCLPDLNVLLSYVGSFYNDFLAGAKKIFNKHRDLFRVERKCCRPGSASMTVFEKDRDAHRDRITKSTE